MANNNNTKNLNVPNLRFPEFKGEWEKCKLEECVVFLDGKRKPIKSSERVSEQKLYPYYGASGIIDYIDDYLFDGKFILLSEDGANILDRNYRVAFIAEGKIWVNNHAHVLQSNDNIDINFIAEKLESLDYSIYNTGTTMPKLNQEVCRNIPLWLPPTEEQVKIGTLLSLLNERITTQSKIIEDLKLLKKTMSQNIFSLKIRFKDEEGNVFSSWKLRKLSDVLIIQGGYAFKSSLFNQGTNKVIRIGDILPIIKLSNFSGIYSSETPNEKYIVRKNDFVMALSGATFGKVGKIEDKGIAYINQRVATFRTKKCLEFFYQLVQINNFKNYISSIPTASAQPNISNDDIGNYKSYIPDVIEQTKIAGFLSTIDKKIETERAILDAYAKQKQYLLANLLI